ncbi:MAG: leucyl aminopeptidase family protein [Parachlamydiaceae bacterium]
MRIKLQKSNKIVPQGATVLDLRTNEKEGLQSLLSTLVKDFRFENFKTNVSKAKEEEIVVITNHPEAVLSVQAIAEGIAYARQLASLPPNLFSPVKLADKLKELIPLGIDVKILSAKDLKTIGMGALLAAGQGSINPPAVAILSWKGRKQTPPLALVGKGVSFDSGGICLKSPLHQRPMKMDKSAAGVIAGVMKTLALIQSPEPVIGVLGFLENMPDGGASRPGDVITTLSGQTVEIVDTDAEGRLLLADCMTYAIDTFSPSALIDLGTLTKEIFASLGTECAGLYTENKALEKTLLMASASSGERLWPLPMGPYFAKQIESEIADMQNSGIDGCGENGACAEFLKKFSQKIPWAHIDLSGASWNEKGPTGFGVHLLTHLTQTEWRFG